MKIQYCSDLHLEFPMNREFLKKNPLTPTGEILIMAGDIIPFVMLDQLKEWINSLSDQFEAVYWVPGNHEYYRDDISRMPNPMKEAIRSNVFLVNNMHVPHGAVDFFFSTLWSSIRPANEWEIERSLRDFHVISRLGKKFTPADFSALHEESRTFLEANLPVREGKRSMVVSHHVPTFLNYPRKYRNSPLNEGFAVELHDLIQDSRADYWLFGHHHFNLPSFQIGKTTMITNQLGYVEHGENSGFDSQAMVELA